MILLKIISLHLSKNGSLIIGAGTQVKAIVSISQSDLAVRLCMSASEVNGGIKRLRLSGLLGVSGLFVDCLGNEHTDSLLPIVPAVEECLVSGVKYFFPAEIGTYTRGIATSYAASVFEKYIRVGDNPIPVWPDAEGDRRGVALDPLYRSVPRSIIQYPDQDFYEMLVFVDAIRAGRVRERDIAVKLLREKLNAA